MIEDLKSNYCNTHSAIIIHKSSMPYRGLINQADQADDDKA
jgi:hypothetical protein